MTEIYLHFLFAHYGLYGNAPVGAAVGRWPVAARSQGPQCLPPVVLDHRRVRRRAHPDLGRVIRSLPRQLEAQLHARGESNWARRAYVRGHIIGRARNNMYVNLSHAWL